MKSPETALEHIRRIHKDDPQLGLGLVRGLLASLNFDGENSPPNPPTVSRVIADCKGVPTPTISELGIILSPREAHEWLSSLPTPVSGTADTFRQKFKQRGSYNKKFGTEAFRNGTRNICCTYAQALHLAEYTGNIKDKFVASVKAEFGLK